MNKKIVFFDIDGTLAVNSLPASPEVCDAIRRLRENGHYAVINTGRAKSYLYPSILDIGFDGAVSAAGAHIEFGGKEVFDVQLPAPLVVETARQMFSRGIGLVLEGTNRIAALNPLTATPDDIPVFKDFSAFERAAAEIGVNKYTYYLHNRSQLEPLLPFLGEHYDLIVHNPDRYGEIVPKGISKATGMKRLTEFLGLSRADSYAIGDSLNDLEMLAAAGCGIAMGNAVEPLLKAADIVTDTFANNGAATALKTVGLI